MSELQFASCEENQEFQAGLLGILDGFQNEEPSDENVLSIGGRILEFIESLLGQIDLPSKEVVLAGVSALLDRIFVKVDLPGPDAVIEPLIKAAVLSAVGSAYDQLVAE